MIWTALINDNYVRMLGSPLIDYYLLIFKLKG